MTFHRKSPKGSIKSCLLVLFTIFLIGVLYTGLQFKNYQDFVSESKSGATPQTFEVKEGESIDQIASRLAQEGILKDKRVFSIPAYKLYFKLNDFDSTSVHAGKFQIPANATTEEIFASFRDKGCSEVQVTIREGLRIEEIADALDQKFQGKNVKFNKIEFITLAKNYLQTPGLTLGFLPPKNLEGYLFPDTYRLCNDLTSREVIDALLTNFDKKVYSVFSPEIATSGRSVDEVLNIAAMVEREARGLDEKKMVAGIILKRLEIGIPLGIDATSQYEFGYSEKQKTWWRTGSELDAVIDTNHRYSTRKNAGLPPSIIANPGADAVLAVLEPTKSDYLFYITGADGKMYYAKDLNTHNYNTCKYLTKTCR